jgi:hypothetical protein
MPIPSRVPSRVQVTLSPELRQMLAEWIDSMPVKPSVSAACQVALERGLKEIENDSNGGFG